MSKFMRAGGCALDRCLKVAILYANRRLIMRSTIDIDSDLLEEARALTGARTPATPSPADFLNLTPAPTLKSKK